MHVKPERAPVRKYPFRGMEVGQSFFVPSEQVDRGVMSRIVIAGCEFARRCQKGTRFSVRRVDGGYRCWRMPDRLAPTGGDATVVIETANVPLPGPVVTHLPKP